MNKKLINKIERDRYTIRIYKNWYPKKFGLRLDPSYSVIQTSKINGIEFGNDVFPTIRKMKNYLKGQGIIV